MSDCNCIEMVFFNHDILSIIARNISGGHCILSQVCSEMRLPLSDMVKSIRKLKSYKSIEEWNIVPQETTMGFLMLVGVSRKNKNKNKNKNTEFIQTSPIQWFYKNFVRTYNTTYKLSNPSYVYLENKCDKKNMKYLKLVIDSWHDFACLGWKKVTRTRKLFKNM